MAPRIEPLPLATSRFSAVRWSIDELHVGVKDALTIARVEQGSFTWWSHGTVWEVEPGAILVQNLGDVCRDLARVERTTCQVITFDAHHGEFDQARRHPPHLGESDMRGAAFHALHDAVRDGADALTLDVVAAEALASFNRRKDEVAVRCPRAVRRAVALVRERYAESLGLDEIAAHAGTDKYHLCRAFRARIGLPPYAYQLRLRVSRAKNLLRAGMPAAHVGASVGFYDQSQFTRHFQRIVGTSPARFARAHER
ncbi:helix-turn-helix domain-containing protein [Chondromyces crocatus]|uniref:AraC family transcriptional regulator n=1 Tax=Chondromyces crocatus TaxID=52 RepID=A0A0K1EKK2_CHOCO|nr:AraC family transcriptional regulator [Chondromyces crocatus]AKT41405.1 AraC family transcriptional regulator [Chondromyces crocatus]